MTLAAERERLKTEEDLAVGALLARARVHRQRQQWEEAIAVCTEALRKHPPSRTACSILGSIYEAQGHWEDAAQWYTMALERDPDDENDRAALARVVVQLSKEAVSSVPHEVSLHPLPSGSERQPVAPSTASSSAVKPVAEKTLEWFDRLFPPGDPRSIARLLYMVSGGIAAVLIVCATIFYAVFQSVPKRTLPALPSPGTAIATVPVSSVPVVVQPPISTPRAIRTAEPTAIAATPSVSVPPQPAPSPTASAAARSPMDDTYRAELNRALGDMLFVSDLERDSTGKQVRMELVVPIAETAEKTRDLVARATAMTVVRLATIAAPTPQSASVRVFVPQVNRPDQPMPVFSGEVMTALVRNVDLSAISYPELLSRFTASRWEGILVPGGEAATPTPTTPHNAPAGSNPVVASPPAPAPLSNPTGGAGMNGIRNNASLTP